MITLPQKNCLFESASSLCSVDKNKDFIVIMFSDLVAFSEGFYVRPELNYGT